MQVASPAPGGFYLNGTGNPVLVYKWLLAVLMHADSFSFACYDCQMIRIHEIDKEKTS